MKLYKGYAMVVASAVIYGCMPLMARYIYADGVNALTLVLLRNLLALPTIAFFARRSKASLRIEKKAYLPIWVLALFGCCLTPLLLFASYNYVPSGTATVIHFIYPSLVVLGGTIVLKHKNGVGAILATVLCVSGIALFYDSGAPLDIKGAALSALSGLVFAFYVLALPYFKYRDTVKGFVFSFHLAVASSVIMLVMGLASSSLCFPTTLKGWGLCLLFATAVTTGAVYFFQEGAFVAGSERAAILSTLEPITSIVIGTLVFSEPLTVRGVAGSALVVSATVVIALFDIFKKKAQVEKGKGSAL